jgi:hypothetical protein
MEKPKNHARIICGNNKKICAEFFNVTEDGEGGRSLDNRALKAVLALQLSLR